MWPLVHKNETRHYRILPINLDICSSMKYIFSISILATLLIFAACDPEERDTDTNLTAITYSPVSYALPSETGAKPNISPKSPYKTIDLHNSSLFNKS